MSLKASVIPFDRFRVEATDVVTAARVANVTANTMRKWAAKHDLGMKVAGRHYISRPALAMYLECDHATLAQYKSGDRACPAVASYLVRLGIA